LNEEIVALSEGHHSILVLGRDLGRIRKVMIEENAGFVRKDIPKGAEAELELGGPRGDGLVSMLATISCLIAPSGEICRSNLPFPARFSPPPNHRFSGCRQPSNRGR